MAFKKLTMTWAGTRPLVMHNERLANRLDPIAREIAALAVSARRKGADLDEAAEAMQNAEFRGGLYVDNDGPFIPGHVLRAVIVAGAKLSKLGAAVGRGMSPPEDSRFDYDGPRSVEEMLKEPNRHRLLLTRSVKIGQARVMRTRPIFPTPWSVKVTIEHDPKMLQESDLIKACSDAGAYIGMGDGRVLGYGRFSVST
jgi:hypothetical protein